MNRKGKRRKGQLLSVWISETLLPSLDQGAKKEDSDRSKFIRDAIREKLARQKAVSPRPTTGNRP